MKGLALSHKSLLGPSLWFRVAPGESRRGQEAGIQPLRKSIEASFYHFPTFLCKSHSAAFTNYRIHLMSGTWLMAWVNPAGTDGAPVSSAPVWLRSLGRQVLVSQPRPPCL